MADIFGRLVPVYSPDSQEASSPVPAKPTMADALADTWPARVAKAIWGGVTLPGDVYAGKVDPLSDEGIGRAADLAGTLGSGGVATAAARPGTAGVFGGRLAATADHAALARAEEMAAKGADRNAILQDTGWFQGVDGKWRFEIADNNATMRVEPVPGGPFNTALQNARETRTGGLLPLEKAMDHPELAAAYPNLADMQIVGMKPGSRGQFIKADPLVDDVPRIAVSDKLTSHFGHLDTGLHEAQHAIQQVEGFAKGGSPEMFYAEHRALDSKVDAINAAMTSAYKRGDNAEYHRLMDERSGVVNRLQELRGPHGVVGDEPYRRLAGEVEARNVQTRLAMTPHERRAKPPWETEGVPAAQQTVRRDSKGRMESRVDSPLFHGSPAEGLTELAPSTRGPLGPGVYTTPVPGVARRYAGEAGTVHELPAKERDIYQGAGHRTNAEYAGWKDDMARLLAAAEPDKKAEVGALLERMWSGDGYPLYSRLRHLYQGDEGAQALFKRAGFEGVSGQIDGPETLLFAPQKLAQEARVKALVDEIRKP